MVDDDQEIKKYEKLLGLGKKKKSKNVPKSIVDSGMAGMLLSLSPNSAVYQIFKKIIA